MLPYSHKLYNMKENYMPHMSQGNSHKLEYHSNRIALLDSSVYMRKMSCRRTIKMDKYVHKFLEDSNKLWFHSKVDNLCHKYHWISCNLVHILNNSLDQCIPNIKLDILYTYFW